MAASNPLDVFRKLLKVTLQKEKEMCGKGHNESRHKRDSLLSSGIECDDDK